MIAQRNEYFDGTLGWLGPDGPVSFDASKLISIDDRPLMVALLSRFGFRAFTRVVFIDWSGGVYEGPYAGRRFGGYVIHMDEASMWTERHLAACQHAAYEAYNQIHDRGYPTVTLEVPPDADALWKWGMTYDPVHDPAGAKLWLERS
jgi:hypothetical protein